MRPPAQAPEQFLMGYLENGEHGSYVLFDRQWRDALQAEQVLFFCLHCRRIVSVDRGVARKTFRRLRPDKLSDLFEQLVDGYRVARDQYEAARMGIGVAGGGARSPGTPSESLSSAPDHNRSNAGNLASYLEKAKETFNREVAAIEQRTDLSVDEKVAKITHTACALCALIAVQPLPFADIFVLTPLQGYFGTRIAAIRGVRVADSEAVDLAKEIVGLMGLGFIAQWIGIGVWKLIAVGAGGLFTIPLVYTLSYGVMKAIDAYYAEKARGRQLSDAQIKAIFKQATRKAKNARFTGADLQAGNR